jgi:hypothetical protein
MCFLNTGACSIVIGLQLHMSDAVTMHSYAAASACSYTGMVSIITVITRHLSILSSGTSLILQHYRVFRLKVLQLGGLLLPWALNFRWRAAHDCSCSSSVFLQLLNQHYHPGFSSLSSHNSSTCFSHLCASCLQVPPKICTWRS